MFFETYLYFVAAKSVATSTRYFEVRLIGMRSKPRNFRKRKREKRERERKERSEREKKRKRKERKKEREKE